MLCAGIVNQLIAVTTRSIQVWGISLQEYHVIVLDLN